MTPARVLVAGLALVLSAGCVTGCTAERPAGRPGPAAGSARPPAPPDVRVGPAVWSTRRSPQENPGLVDVGDDVLLVADLQGGGESRLDALDVGTGERLWREERPRGGAEPVEVFSSVQAARVGPDGAGGEMVTVPYDRVRCAGGTVPVDPCERRAGLEARDATTGDRLWRWQAPRGLDATDLLTGTVVDGGAVLLWVGGGIVALDATTGERRWGVADLSPAERVEDGLVLVGTSSTSDEPYRLLDLDTGEQVRTLGPDERVQSLMGPLLTVVEGADVRLTDARSGEVLGRVAGSDGVAPVPLRSADGLAWVSADDELVTLRRGETEPVVAPLPDGMVAQDLSLGAFLGDAAGGVLLVPGDDGLRVVGRDGGVSEPDGTRALLVDEVAEDSVVVQVAEARDAVAPLAVRPVR